MTATAASRAALDISNGVARVHKERLGRGPELVLASIGRDDLIAKRRSALDRALEAELSQVVSDAVCRPVRCAMSAIDQATGLRALIFILGAAEARPYAAGGQNSSRSSSRSMT